jgi:hypothetical protein
MHSVLAVLMFTMLLAFSSPALAGPCGTTAGLDTSQVTFRGSDSDDCSGVHFGNSPNEADVPFVVSQYGSDPWTALLTESNTVTLSGITFSLDVVGIGDTSGTWELTFTSDTPITDSFDLLVFVKASDRYVDYFFNDESFTTNGVGEGTFTIAFLNNGEQIAELSHLNVAFRDGDGISPPPPPPPPVPAPATLLLLGAGFLATAIGRRFVSIG